MRKIPSDRKYTENHLWFKATGEEEGLIGLTDFGQQRLGDVIAAELPRSDTRFAVQDVIVYLEGILDSLEMEAFSNLEILETNSRLEIHPDVINRDPYEAGWILKVKLTGLPRWMDAPSYAEFLQNGLVNEGA